MRITHATLPAPRSHASSRRELRAHPKHDQRLRRIALMSLAVSAAACNNDATSPVPFTNTLSIVSGNAQIGTVGAALGDPVVIKVVDEKGNPIEGVTVTFAPVSTSGSLDATTGLSDVSGLVHFGWTLGTVAASDSVVIASTNATSIYATATASPGAPAQVTVVSGDSQAGTAGGALPAPLVVKVTDQYGNAVPGVTITWSSSDGSLASTTSVTDANGLAQNTLTLGTSAGQLTITAEVTGQVEAIFTETAG